jgi:hypothetical protein
LVRFVLWLSGTNCASIPKGATPAPLGTYVHRFEDWQKFKAEADDFVIYKHEWLVCNPLHLGPYGSYHLTQILQRLPSVPFPVLIEVDADPSVNDARQQLIQARLAMAGIQNADRRVLVGFPQPGGLYGEEAPPIYARMIQGGGGAGQYGQAFGRNTFPGFGATPSFFGTGGLGAAIPPAAGAFP